MLRDPVADLLREIFSTATQVVVIHDYFIAYVVQDAATIPNAESYIFSPVSASHRPFRLLKDNKSFQSLEELKGLSSIQGNVTPVIQNFFALQVDFHSQAAGTRFTIYNSCRSIEGDTVIRFQAVAVLELLVVRRFSEYAKRVKEFGMVVRDWAPQVDILEHPSTSGFMSHCGWNSCLESITVGVPILMHSDQPRNAFMVTDILKVGLAVTIWAQREQIVTSSTICGVVKMLMASREGEEIKMKVEGIGGATHQEVKEGGVSPLGVGFIHYPHN
ncbi:hypothetical protein RHMOL_Rhmol04G0143900 [Rhododendron molle]|uniref:Uncharacterized protein n=1 Tax=Rhododendron molle TaxID=49168 RepID=A0ACC0P0C6_RHOML|nr:hypothetical protein RHMOL_Rhmol04G0143900 [Rhododendron molle]